MTSELTRYAKLLAVIKARIQAAQTRAVVAVDAELIRLYWGIGRLLDVHQVAEGWGAGVIPRLASDLRNELPEPKGFSSRNLDRMLAFARAYPGRGSSSKSLGGAHSPQPVAKTTAPIACCGNCPGATTRCCRRKSSRSRSGASTSRRRWPRAGAGRR